MKLAYGDPPYPGQAKRHYSHDPSGIVAKEVDHRELLIKLRDEYDGWALSSSEPAILTQLAALINELFPPHTVRIAPWVKPFCSFKPTHRVQYTWEPVFYIPTRPKGSKKVPSVKDHVIACITTKKGTHGAKPPEFCDWILDLLGYQEGDTFDDLYPGSGSMAEALKRRKENNGQQQL